MTKTTGSQTDALRNARWRTSSYTVNAGNCVEVAEVATPHLIAVRDTKDRSLPAARVRPAAWSAFTHAAKAGAFDQPFIGWPQGPEAAPRGRRTAHCSHDPAEKARVREGAPISDY